jgi:hypothetical protein
MNQVSHGYGLLCLLAAAAPIAAQQPTNTGPVRLATAAEGPAAAATPAAEESADNVETVTVTGIRAAIESAIAIKHRRIHLAPAGLDFPACGWSRFRYQRPRH